MSTKQNLSTLTALSPLDGRYWPELAPLADFFSEQALLRSRVLVEIRYVLALSQLKPKLLRRFSRTEQARLLALYEKFSERDAQRIKAIERTTKHDVKAVEYFIKEKLQRTSLRDVLEFVHFGLTSEDVNNLAYSLLLRDGVRQVIQPQLTTLVRTVERLARRYADWPLLSLTHGQPATPTTLGKELRVLAERLRYQANLLKQLRLTGKLAGATGNWAAAQVAAPGVNWLQYTRQFVRSLGLEPNLFTTQIEPHDRLAELCHIIVRLNTIVKAFDQDMWLYISRGVFMQNNVAGEIGSSAMPHKINPIYFENSEGNAGLAIALASHLAEKLPQSRLQRDLTDSTVLRNQGVMLGYTILAITNVLRGLERVKPNRVAMLAELDQHWEVLAEPIQTVLRRLGKATPYEQLKKLTRGHQLTRNQLHQFIDQLDLPKAEKNTLKKLTPATYIGLSNKIAKLTP